ncbi:hypothetical protein CVT91_00995 [Candidatus Atribacteria bacterium HGW-Atribacteria-1]|nr:MAG: hypothetical protein CVT91_00995 [Candidatus Atribacteria bacterium HGW-Atribacteria-1]
MSSKVLGILGTSKNTGKTTTTSALLEIANNKNLSVGITSIGYDGEDIDNITGLPKPRIFAQKGTLIATAKNCLKSGTAQIKTLKETEISTPLGKIIIGEVMENGLVIIAGPNKGEELSMVIDKLEKLGNKLILVDGAINRIVPLMKTDTLILTTGAARNINIDFLVKEIQCISYLFELPKIEKKDLMNLKNIEQKVITLIQKDYSKKYLETNSLISLSDIQELINKLNEETQLIFIPGILTEFALNELIKKEVKLLEDKNIIIPNPTHLLVGSNTIYLIDTLLKIKKLRINLKIIKTIPILAVTVNPFYPLYRYENSRYEKGWVNREELYNKVKSVVSIPVIDIVKEGGNGLFDIIKK